MSDPRSEPLASGAPAPGGDAPHGRQPFVAPSVQKLGALAELTLIGGSL